MTYTAAIVAAYALLLAGMLADIITSLRGWHRGAWELNPLVGELMLRVGPVKGLLIAKAAYLVACAGATAALWGSWYVVAGVAIVAVLHGAAALWNERGA